ncbi:hypothetical protein KJ855_00090 [Patescibacteria group bacterium]|nr:hypothetical protein [Patescibacteria group bacterium]
MKKTIYKIIFALLLFFLIVGGGFGVWQYMEPARVKSQEMYLNDMERLWEAKDSEALWELEKAYFVGLGHVEYRQKRALLLYDLGDLRAKKELEELVDKGWVSDKVYFACGEMSFREGDYEMAEEYFKNMSDAVSVDIQGKVLLYLTHIAGSYGNWEEVTNYLDQAKNDNVSKEDTVIYDLALALVLGDWQMVEVLMGSQDIILREKIGEVFEYVDMAYYLAVADVLMDMDLSDWSRQYLQEASNVIAKKDIYKLYAKSYLQEGNCRLSLDYLKMVEDIDSTDGEVNKMLVEVYQCLGLEEWKVWEESKLS